MPVLTYILDTILADWVSDKNFYNNFTGFYKHKKSVNESYDMTIESFKDLFFFYIKQEEALYGIELQYNDTEILLKELIAYYSEEVEKKFIPFDNVEQYIRQNWNIATSLALGFETRITEFYNNFYIKTQFKQNILSVIKNIWIEKPSLGDAKFQYFDTFMNYVQKHMPEKRDELVSIQGLEQNFLFTLAMSTESLNQIGKHIYPNQICALIDRRYHDARKETQEPTLHKLEMEIDCHISNAQYHFDRVNKELNKINQEKIMTPEQVFQERKYIDGVNAKELTDEDIYNVINDVEKEIERLNKMKTKPKKVEAKIKAFEEQLKKLVEFVDSRD
jgi:hypothetical protein